MANLDGTEIASNMKRSQVYQATHVGERILPYMNRSFISFTYGGKRIEDFNLIATISGDRLSRDAYASFSDTVTTYDILDGQHYWATHFQANQMDFTLSTDGIDQKMLDDFLHWFRPGIGRELILAEHPNRAIIARVKEVPRIDMLPFESTTVMKISSETYKVKTTLYKGDILLTLTMDDPYWYSIVNILGKIEDSNGHRRYVDLWDDISTGEQMSIFASQDALKILYEDGIPLGSMISNNMLLGNGAYANVENNTSSLIWSLSETVDNYISLGEGARINGTITGEEDPASSYSPGSYVGIIAGAIVDASDEGITSLSPNIPAYFYYAGTAPATTQITFTLSPRFRGGYISIPGNSFASATGNPYNTITIESLHTQTLRFTTPNFYTSYNTVISIFTKHLTAANTWENIRALLRDQVRHKVVREWAIKCIDAVIQEIQSNEGDITRVSSGYKSILQQHMEYLLKDAEGEYFPVTFSFNSETGEAIGYFKYRQVTTEVPENEEAWESYGNILLTPEAEDVGDMLRSNYIIIQDRNYPSSDGKILGWANTNDTTKQYSHKITHDVTGGLTNLQILYKNMYL